MCKCLGFTNSSLQPTLGLRFVVLEFIQVLKSIKASWDLEHIVLEFGCCLMLILAIFLIEKAILWQTHWHMKFTLIGLLKFVMLVMFLSRFGVVSN